MSTQQFITAHDRYIYLSKAFSESLPLHLGVGLHITTQGNQCLLHTHITHRALNKPSIHYWEKSNSYAYLCPKAIEQLTDFFGFADGVIKMWLTPHESIANCWVLQKELPKPRIKPVRKKPSRFVPRIGFIPIAADPVSNMKFRRTSRASKRKLAFYF